MRVPTGRGLVGATQEPSSSSFVIECRAGRLVEARIKSLRTVADVDEYARATGRVLARIAAPQRAVICADHRAVRVYPAAVADAFAALLATINSRVERAALLISPENATFAMQLTRVVSEAAHGSRRFFSDRSACAAYLGTSLDDAERRRLEIFLDEA